MTSESLSSCALICVNSPFCSSRIRKRGDEENHCGKRSDVVLNSLGAETWLLALWVLGSDGRFIFFGTMTGAKVDLDLFPIYDKQVKIIGTTGGSRNEMEKITEKERALKVRVWRKFRLEETANALKSLSSKERDGRILIEP